LNNHKLNLNQFPENYHLIAIHSGLDEFRLAFFLNKKLNIGLKRKNNDIYLAEQDANYSQYEYLDETKYLKWIFFSNKSLVLEKNSEEDLSLFGLRNTASNEMNLLSQQKSVDYFLIIENIVNKKYVDKVLKKISEISGVITSFISENRLENKENLIFS
tara:strand:- start:2827 stop:3303 length:477 start_codon:yes stop_codon:yes gene_type:complete